MYQLNGNAGVIPLDPLVLQCLQSAAYTFWCVYCSSAAREKKDNKQTKNTGTGVEPPGPPLQYSKNMIQYFETISK